MSHLERIDLDDPEFGDLYDELSLWSAPFGLLLLDRVPIKADLTILDVGAGTGFLRVELALRLTISMPCAGVVPPLRKP